MTGYDRASDAAPAGDGDPRQDLLGHPGPPSFWTDARLTAQLGSSPSLSSDGHSSLLESKLSSPLTALVTSAHLLLEDLGALGPPQLRERVSALRYRALILHMVAENLFCTTAIEEGRLQLQPQRTVLDEVIAEVATSVLPLLHHKRQHLEVAGQGSRATVRLDPRRIGQVLMNLIWTASNGAAEDSPLQIAARTSESAICVQVSAGAPRMSEPLSQSIAQALPATAPGSNLEIDVARSIVQAHGGTLRGTQGNGIRFWFELPRS